MERVNSKGNSFLALLGLVWWAANNAYAIQSQKLFERFRSPLLVIDLCLVQVVVGLAMSTIIQFWKVRGEQQHSRHPEMPHRQKLDPGHPRSGIMLAIGFVHLSATALNNLSYRQAGATSTLVWKLAEPAFTVALKYTILQETTSAVSMLGIGSLLVGVVTFSGRSISSLSLSPVILANILFPMRNVLIKRNQKDGQFSTTEQRYSKMFAASLPFCLMALVFRLLIESPDLDAIPFLLQNAMLFNLYQLSSIGILERLDSLTHSVLNALKRFSGIFLSVIILRETLRLNHALGLVLTFIGVALYKIGGRLSSSRKEQKFVLKAHSLPVFAGTLWFCVCFILVPIYGGKWMTSNSGIGSAVSRVGISPATPRLENSSGQEARRWPSATEGDVYLKVLYDAIDMEKTYSSKMAKDVFSYSGGNTGNLVWQHSGLHRLPDFSNVKMCNGSQPACAAKEAIGPDSHVVVFRPVANIFHDKNVRGFKFYVDLLNEGGKVIFVGLGVQAYFHDGHYDEKKYANSEPELKPRDFQLEPEAKELLQTMQKKKNKMLTRGNFTTMALKRAGYDYAISAGCPSLMLSMETRLGRVLEPKYRAVANRIGDKSLKVAINIVPEPGLMRVYIGLLRDYPNSLIYAQTSNDLRRLKALNVSEERIRVFTNIEKWRESLEEMDVAFGLRIHGNMIALGSSLPAFVVAPDYRVLELVQRMKVPHVSIMEANLFAEHIDVAKLVANAEFDGEEFDANRCEIAGLYRELFGSYGFDVSPSVRRISEIC